MPYSIHVLPSLLLAGIAALTAGCTHAAQSGMHASTALVRAAEFPARLCLPLDADTVTAVARGDTRLSLQLRNRIPVLRYSPAFHLMLVDGDSRQRLGVFGMQVDHVENASVTPQRFMFNLRDAVLAPNAQGNVCFDIERDEETSAGAAVPADAQMEITVSWQTLPAR